jgi:DNA primase
MTQHKLKLLLTEYGYPVQETGRSYITTCLVCGKSKHLYIFKETGYGKCMRCNASFSPESIVVQLAGCSYHEAKNILNAADKLKGDDRIKFPTFIRSRSKININKDDITEFVIPVNFNILGSEHSKAWDYLNKRGIETSVIIKYNLMYADDMKRIIIPIFMNGKCVGWQGRDITGEAELPYIFPFNFKRAKILIGLDKLNNRLDYVILSEGPFDFLKLAILQNVVCSMGKNVSKEQLLLIKKLSAKRIYIALDPDAWDLFDKITNFLEPDKEVWLMVPPNNKKDFGDCTNDEILTAFAEAKRYYKKSFLSDKIFKQR